MPLFLWKKSYEINIPEIDVQHRRLVGMINELSDAMLLKQGHSTVPHILEELSDYVQLHFATEEKLMRRMNFPNLEEHCQEHLKFTEQVLDFKVQYSSEHKVDTRELLGFLCDWLKNHIVVSDKVIGKFRRRVEMGLG